MKRLEEGLSGKRIDDPDYRKCLIATAIGYAATIQKNHTVPFELLGRLSGKPFRSVTWPEADMGFVNDLIDAMEAQNASGGGKQSVCTVLVQLVEAGPEEVVGRLATCWRKWFTDGLPSYDPLAVHSGPFSIVSRHGNDADRLQQGLWWLGYALLCKGEDVRTLLTERILHQGLEESAESEDLVFAIMVRLALTISSSEVNTAMALIGMSEALAYRSSDECQARLIRTFKTLLGPEENSAFSIAGNAGTPPADMLLDAWSRRLVRTAEARSPDIRAAAAQALREWRRLSEGSKGLSFGSELADTIAKLEKDARARVRWACGNEN
ncbi:MAG: hypothetical protein HQ581_25095 [Planctomycetes bacterium]|nr:hypothetical protein [Planctomycetota bacterium]